jgi:hypothetical protein
MKKSVLFIAAVFALTAVSCKKERTCTCTTTSTSTVPGSTSSTSTSKWTIEKDSKKNARRDASCYNYKDVRTQTLGGTSFTFTDDVKCELN